MEKFNLLSVVAASFLASAIVNIFIFLFAVLTRTNIQLFALLGTLATKEATLNQKPARSNKAMRTGAFLYYSFGLLIAFLYATSWHLHVVKPRMMETFILGFFTGAFVLLILNFSLKKRADLGKVRLADYFSTLLIGNILYAINFLYFYLLFKTS